jgi:hypothetical protein
VQEGGEVGEGEGCLFFLGELRSACED